jgi:penicillin V acylase-like amidase (Ntn superfamily)
MLDNCRTVAEVVASDARIRISTTMPLPLHFLVCDRKGHPAVVEFINVKLVGFFSSVAAGQQRNML